MVCVEELVWYFEVMVCMIYCDILVFGEVGVLVIGEVGVGYMLMKSYYLLLVMLMMDEVVVFFVGGEIVKWFIDVLLY